MTVYVDDSNLPYGRMTMCHMVADTTHELNAMADKIGVARRWIQKPGTHREHYDICLSKKRLAIQHGATEVTWMELGRLLKTKRDAVTGISGGVSNKART